jgi:hypothetical protein
MALANRSFDEDVSIVRNRSRAAAFLSSSVDILVIGWAGAGRDRESSGR